MSLAVKQYRLMQIPSSDTATVTDTNGGGTRNSSNISFRWENGTIKSINFEDMPTSGIKRIGIQTIPGVEFSINDSPLSNIIIGPSGIFELDVEASGSIVGKIDLIENTLLRYFEGDSSTAYLIMDVIYETGGSTT